MERRFIKPLPLLRVRNDIDEMSRKYFENAVNSSNSYVFVAEDAGRVIGFIKEDLRERIFYEPRLEGNIVEFYRLPEYRRKGIGAALLDYAVKLLKEKAEIVTAEFPSLNKIAVEFYTRLGFRGIVSVYARES